MKRPDDQDPHSPEVSAAQVRGVLRLLERPGRVLDLGCGAGRVLVPLRRAGHEVVGIDRDAEMLARCRAADAGGGTVALHAVDFTRAWPDALGSFDLVCCLGNTIMTVWDVDEAVALLGRVESALRPGGVFVIDDVPGQCWVEVAEGNWQAGVSPDGAMQLVWAEDDAVFAIRSGDDVDDASWTPGSGDQRLRLWTLGALRLAGRLSGLSAIERRPGEALLIMRRPGP